jgi:hypothetical protein
MSDINPLLPKPIDMPSIGSCDPRQIRFYGCTRCQRCHFEGTALFREHLYWQDKHSVRTVSRLMYFTWVSQEN